MSGMSRLSMAATVVLFVFYLIFGYAKQTFIIDLVGFKPGIIYQENTAKEDFNDQQYDKLSLAERLFNQPFVLSVVSFFFFNILFVYLFALVIGHNKQVMVSITVFIIAFFAIAVIFNLLSLWEANPVKGLFYSAFKGIAELLFSIRLGFLGLIVLVILKMVMPNNSSSSKSK